MANIKSAKKRARQAEVRRQHNASYRSKMRTAIKKVLSVIKTGKKTDADSAFKDASSLLDRAASKGIIHKNNAARNKSRLMEKVNALSASA